MIWALGGQSHARNLTTVKPPQYSLGVSVAPKRNDLESGVPPKETKASRSPAFQQSPAISAVTRVQYRIGLSALVASCLLLRQGTEPQKHEPRNQRQCHHEQQCKGYHLKFRVPYALLEIATC